MVILYHNLNRALYGIVTSPRQRRSPREHPERQTIQERLNGASEKQRCELYQVIVDCPAFKVSRVNLTRLYMNAANDPMRMIDQPIAGLAPMYANDPSRSAGTDSQ